MISGYMPISPGVPHTLPVGFLAPCSRLPGCAECTSSPTCSMWWCADDGPAPQTGWGSLHVQSWPHALPRWMFGCPHSLVHTLLDAPPSLGNVHAWALHTRDGVHNILNFLSASADDDVLLDEARRVVIASQCICDTLLFLCMLHTRGDKFCSGLQSSDGCYLPCTVAYPGMPAVHPSTLLPWTWWMVQCYWGSTGMGIQNHGLGKFSKALAHFHILYHQVGTNHRYWDTIAVPCTCLYTFSMKDRKVASRYRVKRSSTLRQVRSRREASFSSLRLII